MTSDKIIEFLEKNGGPYGKAAEYFGGLEKLKNLSKKSSELKNYIDKKSLGYFTFTNESRKKFKFKFDIISINKEVADEDLEFTSIGINLHINIDGLSDEELQKIGEWVQSYLDELDVNYYFQDSNLNGNDNISLSILYINGEDIEWELGDAFPVPDIEIDIMLQGKKLNESLKNIQGLVNKIL